ncbi:MAG: hypothetical protein NTW87_20215 [Planctomycetota bacterium]|nr:hypothetical protein [Planctomycetota bacterium]
MRVTPRHCIHSSVWRAVILLFVAATCCASAEELAPRNTDIGLSNTYGAFAVKWVTEATAQTKIARKAEVKAARARQQIFRAVQKLAKQPKPDNIGKFTDLMKKLLTRTDGQTSALVWGALVQVTNLTPQVGIAGTVSVGDTTSAGFSGDYVLSQQYSATVKGYAVTAFYSAPPTSYDQPFMFNALVRSDDLTAVLGGGSGVTVGLWVCVIVDPRLNGALAAANVTNETTAAEGRPVSVPVGLTISGLPAPQGLTTFDATYFSVVDLFGVGVPAETAPYVQEAFGKLRAGGAKSSP